jgi:hypothetical protein
MFRPTQSHSYATYIGFMKLYQSSNWVSFVKKASQPGKVTVITTHIAIIAVEYSTVTVMKVYLTQVVVNNGLLNAQLLAECKYFIANVNGCKAVRHLRSSVYICSPKNPYYG